MKKLSFEVIFMRPGKKAVNLEPGKRILEIGPLDKPMLKKNDADVYYADILSTQEVKARYQNEAGVNKAAICEIDFVIRGSYTETFRNVQKFDYIISSHVLEHVPRLIEFFQDTVNILNTHGKMYLFLPDCRYCSDYFRRPTSFAELYYIHTQGLKFAPWQVLDRYMQVPLNDPKIFATNKRLFPLLAQREPFAKARERLEKALDGEFTPVHYSTFTPQSFLLLLHEMTRAEIFPYKLVDFFPTQQYDFTFGAALEACPELPGAAEMSELVMDRLRGEMLHLVDHEESLK
jgi:SAM-dependent methyltransferase